MFGLGWLEVGLIALAAILVFGPKKLPEMGNALGNALRGFKEGLHEDPEQEQPEEKSR